MEGLKGYWTFEESSRNTIIDESGNSKNATIRGNGAIVNNGVSNKGLKLTGEKGTFFEYLLKKENPTKEEVI